MPNPLNTYIHEIYMIWYGLILWHINHRSLFNTTFYLYIYMKYIWFGLVWFYGISTIVGYLMPNPLYIYIKYIWFGLFFFYGISTLLCYIMPNLLYTSSPSSYLQLVWPPIDWTSCAPSYIIVRHPPSSCGRHKSCSFNSSTVKVIFWYPSTGFTQVHFLFWQLGRGQYVTLETI